MELGATIYMVAVGDRLIFLVMGLVEHIYLLAMAHMVMHQAMELVAFTSLE